MMKNLKNVSRILFGRGCFCQLDEILAEKRQGRDSFMLFLVDDVFTQSPLRERMPLRPQDSLLWVNVDDEPKQHMWMNSRREPRASQVTCRKLS